jgi:DNA-binding response OmpR family regulator
MRVLTATRAAEARELAAREKPVLVLADYRLDESDPDGLELLRELCGPDLSAAAGALITADHSAALSTRARESGFPLLRKPLKPAALRALLSALAGQRRGSAL